MKKLPSLLLFLILVSTSGWACNSFEDCMQSGTNWDSAEIPDYVKNATEAIQYSIRNNEIEQSCYLKALCFKLSDLSTQLGEISKKLDSVADISGYEWHKGPTTDDSIHYPKYEKKNFHREAEICKSEEERISKSELKKLKDLKGVDRTEKIDCETALPFECDWDFIESCKEKGYFKHITKELWLKNYQ